MAKPKNIKLDGPLATKGFRAFQDGIDAPRKTACVGIVIADDEKALFYRAQNKNLANVGTAEPAIDYIKEQGNEFIGREPAQRANPNAQESRTGNMQGFEPSDESQKHEEILFAKELAAYLDKAVEENAFDELVLIAPPNTLGRLRDSLPKKVKDIIRSEMDKDLTNLPEQDLRKQLEKVVFI